MAKPGTIYRISNQTFHKTDNIPVFTDISDNDNLIDDADTQAVVDLIGSGKPQEMSTIDNNEDPMTVIKALQYITEFNSDNGVNMNTFASGSDQRWGVHAYQDTLPTPTQTIFKGFLSLDDMSEAFMPEPNTVVLTANDGLGFLKDIPLTDFDGRTPSAYNRIIDYIAWCLSKTGLQLQINCAFNIKNSGLITNISIQGTSAQHFFDINYLDAKTFEDEIGTCINCYEVLQQILGYEARIFQDKGAWWIVRTDEIEHPTRGLYISTFDYQGTFIENLGERNYEKEIGKDFPYTIFFSKEQTITISTRPNKSAELNFLFEQLNKPENKDFSAGAVIDDSNPLLNLSFACT